MQIDRISFVPILRILKEHEVEFILVGALAGVLQGALATTQDVDILHRRTAENVSKLRQALLSMGAYYWEHINKRLEPEERTLMLPGHHLLKTDFGFLDVLGTVGDKQSYEDLIDRTEELSVSGHNINALNLEALIETKEQAGRDKDKLALPLLRAALSKTKERENDSIN
jgi:predicted nucleotidyltransferase